MKKKKAAALLVCGLLVLGLAACGGNPSLIGNFYDNALSIDGREISSGLYLTVQYNAYREAQGLVEDSEKDLFRQEVEGVKAIDWIRDKTMENLRKYVCVERMCYEREILLTEENLSYLDQTMQYFQMEEDETGVYAKNGISYNSMKSVIGNSMLYEQLFEELYAPGSELTPTDEALKRDYEAQYAHVRYVMLPTADNTGEEAVDKTAEVKAIAEGLLAEAEGGASFDEVAEKGVEEVYALVGRDFDETSMQGAVSTSYWGYEPKEGDDTYSPEFLAKLQGQQVGDFGTYEMGTMVLLYEKIPAFADDEEFEGMRTTVLRALCEEDYAAYLETIYGEYPVEEVTGAVAYLSPRKIVQE